MFRRFPHYFQLDSHDCGPTCLKMIAKFYGRTIGTEKLKIESYYSRTGVSLLGLSEAAESIGFSAAGVQLKLEDLNDVPLPCILHWSNIHFVVLYKISKSKAYIADPSGGLLTYDIEELRSYWATELTEDELCGRALLLEPTERFFENASEEQSDSKNGIAYLTSYLIGFRSLMFQLVFGILTSTILIGLSPFLARSVVDTGIKNNDISFVYLVLISQIVMFFGNALTETIRRWVLFHLSSRLSISLISNFLRKIFELPLSFFNGRMTGDILQRIDDHYKIESFLTGSSLNMVFSSLSLLTFSIVLIIYNPLVFAVFSVFSIVYFAYVISFQKHRGKLDYKRFNQMARSRNNLIEVIHGMSEIKLNDGENLKRKEWEDNQAKMFELNLEGTKILQLQDLGGSAINEIKNVLILFLTVKLVIGNQISLGTMMAIQFIIGQLNVPLNEFIGFIRSWQDAKISIDRIGEITKLDNEDSLDKYQNIDFDNIVISDLSFQYQGPESPKVLNRINISISKGKVTAIVGTSGSGKTTLMKLLLKFYRPTTGAISVGQSKLDNLSTKAWRKKCGVVMQDGYIFSDSIQNNITLSHENVDHGRLTRSVEIANLSAFIQSLPSGLHTPIGAYGVGLSGGQVQRILIARAIYKDPEYIFFDEATSSLDASNEKAIVDKLNSFFKGRTVLIIAHRLSTVKNADKIIVLKDGIIQESGTHNELIKNAGSYFQLIRNQLELGE